ncbi:MAG TPA: lipoyl(octanoyl) transferase LipB [Solirubrobacterales bacterium]|nr:lipoyl(octanoyl) transferase LipB [Solirubrobacterales bacterium]
MSSMKAEVLVARCGLVPYAEARAAQRRLEAARQRDEIADALLLLEHPPVYTRGRRSAPAELPMGVEWYEMQGIEVHDTDRGGRVTYHGPGQLVAYPIVSLKPYGDDVHAYVRRLERVAIGALAAHGVEAGTIEGLTGVWTAGAGSFPSGATEASVAEDVTAGRLRKIGSIGVHVSRGVTTHGLAINVNNDLQPFEWIVPCGIEGARMTSLGRERGGEQDLGAFADTVAAHFGEVFERVPVATDPTELGVAPATLGTQQ